MGCHLRWHTGKLFFFILYFSVYTAYGECTTHNDIKKILWSRIVRGHLEWKLDKQQSKQQLFAQIPFKESSYESFTPNTATQSTKSIHFRIAS